MAPTTNGSLTFRLGWGGWLLQKFCPFARSVGAVFPEICAFTEPIVAILTDCYMIIVAEDAFADAFVAAVIAEDERGGKHRPGFTGNAYLPCSAL